MSLTVRRSETAQEVPDVYDVFDERGFLGNVWKDRYQSPRTGATGTRWFHNVNDACPEWGFVRRKDATEHLAASVPVPTSNGRGEA